MATSLASEANIHQTVVGYLKAKYPEVMFRTDYAAGIKLTIGQATKHKNLQSGRAWPDLFVAWPVGSKHGLFLELKKPGARVFLKTGELSTDPHIQEQAKVIEELQLLGYAADFAIGADEACKKIDIYMKGALG